jgi:hypothetical protein
METSCIVRILALFVLTPYIPSHTDVSISPGLIHLMMIIEPYSTYATSSTSGFSVGLQHHKIGRSCLLRLDHFATLLVRPLSFSLGPSHQFTSARSPGRVFHGAEPRGTLALPLVVVCDCDSPPFFPPAGIRAVQHTSSVLHMIFS